MTAAQDQAVAFCVGLIERFQTEYRTAAAAAGPDGRHICTTCAFNGATNGMEGQDRTALSVLLALWSTQPFYCHAGFAVDEDDRYIVPKDRSTLTPCAGFAFVAGMDKARLMEVVLATLDEHFGAMPRADDDQEAFDGLMATIIGIVA